MQVKISGYAASGGGRGIERVDVSVDGGKTWMEASRSQKRGIQYISDAANSDKWAWVLFEVTADIQHSTEIIAKAVCSISSLPIVISLSFLCCTKPTRYLKRENLMTDIRVSYKIMLVW